MAVFTVVSDQEIAQWLAQYDAGSLLSAQAIASGIENTNYFVDTSKGRWVLTLVERLPTERLPFHLNLMKHLAQRGIPCPEPLADREGRLWSMLNGKPATLVTRLPGRSVEDTTAPHCHAIGQLLARMHLAAADFGPAPANVRGADWWPQALTELTPLLPADQLALIHDELAVQLAWRQQAAFAALPASAVHADCFRDNVLFDTIDAPGIIDFYFACHDTWIFDLAVVCNDWCLAPDHFSLDSSRLMSLLEGYQNVRRFDDVERQGWPMALRAAALRFWLSRLYDALLPREAAMLQPKDPEHFRKILLDRRNMTAPGC
ncbi:MAG: homoserine kinase [Lautropia sp.]|nr:homoserine kinase [Lautropia sp.]